MGGPEEWPGYSCENPAPSSDTEPGKQKLIKQEVTGSKAASSDLMALQRTWTNTDLSQRFLLPNSSNRQHVPQLIIYRQTLVLQLNCDL